MRHRVMSLVLSVLLVPASLRAQAQTVKLLDYQAPVPSTWVARAPSSSSRLAQYVVPGRDSASNTEVVVFFFGANQGANVSANLERWRAQFSAPNGESIGERISRDSTGAFPLTIAEYRGTYRRGIGAGSADSVKTGQALVSVITETPRGPLFIQLFGPEARVAAERETFLRWVKAIK